MNRVYIPCSSRTHTASLLLYSFAPHLSTFRARTGMAYAQMAHPHFSNVDITGTTMKRTCRCTWIYAKSKRARMVCSLIRSAATGLIISPAMGLIPGSSWRLMCRSFCASHVHTHDRVSNGAQGSSTTATSVPGTARWRLPQLRPSYL